MTQYVGLDVSLKETKPHVLDEAAIGFGEVNARLSLLAIAASIELLRGVRQPILLARRVIADMGHIGQIVRCS